MKMRVWYNKLKGAITDIVPGLTRVLFEVFDKDGKSVQVLEADFGDLPDNVQAMVSLYGLNKLLTDRTSDAKDKLTKLDQMDDTLARLMAGEWAKERAVGAIVVSPEVEALAQHQDLTIPECQAALAQYDKVTRQKLFSIAAIKSAAEKIREARKERKVVSLDELI